ncbi:glycoside hydrolase family 88 protein [Paludibacter sp.]
MKKAVFILGGILIALASCTNCTIKQDVDIIKDNVQFAEKQIGHQVELIERSGKILNPRTVSCDKIQYVPIDDWTSGFFPGTMWYMYELSGNDTWKYYGIKYTEELDSVKYLTWHHDVGFMINCSYGNAYKVTKNEAYKEVMIEAAKSLATRYRPTPGVIQSWDENRGWQGTRGWMCPVIIDNMMNLELFFEVTRFTGDSSFYKMAVSHADVTMANHFREDYSCYHVIDYDKIKGGVRHKQTAQGYADESAWARGQAWAIYGYTVCYRETHDIKYLEFADKIYNYLFTHKNMPEDLIPYWDFDAPDIPNEPRDASAAAVIASALYELSTYDRPQYKETADKIIESLSSPAYRAILGTNHNFLLLHSVGSIPHGHEVDVPLNYADYYFLEALLRKKNL